MENEGPKPEQQLPQVEQRVNGIYLEGKPLYSTDKIRLRDRDLERIAPKLIKWANEQVAQDPSSHNASIFRSMVHELGLNSELVNINVNKGEGNK